MKYKKRVYMLLSFFIALSIMLRFVTIFQKDFWFDEAFTYHIAALPLHTLLQAVLTDNNPPLYYLFIHLLLKLDSSQIFLRLSSFLFFAITIPVVYVLFKRFIRQKIVYTATVLYIVSPLSIYLSTETRLHSLAILMLTISTLCFFYFILKPTLKNQILFILFSIMSIYTQYYLFLLFLPFTWIIYRNKTHISKRKWFVTLCIIICAFLPWLFYLLHTYHNECACPPTFLSLPSTLVSPIVAGLGSKSIRFFTELPLFINSFFLFSVILFLFFFYRGIKKSKLLIPFYFLPLFILSIGGLFFPIFSPRAFSIFSPFFFGIVAYGIFTFRQKYLITAILCILLGVISVIQVFHPFFSEKSLQSVHEITKTKDIPTLHTSVATYYSLNYYNQRKKQTLITSNPLSYATVQFIGGKKESFSTNSSSIWLIDTEKWTDKKEKKEVLDRIAKSFVMVKQYSIDEITVSLFKKKK